MFKVFVATSAALAISSTQAWSKEEHNWLSLLSPDRILTYAVQSAVLSGRRFADISYSGLNANAIDGRVVLYDLKVEPYKDVLPTEDCTITADVVNFVFGPLDTTDFLELSAEAFGLEVSSECVGLEWQTALRLADLTDIIVPHVTYGLTYQVSSGSVTYLGAAEVTGLANVTVEAELPYFSVVGFDFEEPVVYLSSLKFTAEDLGAWDRLNQYIPLMFRDPNTSQVAISEALASTKRRYLAFDQGDLNWQPSFDAFAESVQKAAPKFLSEPNQLVIETNISEPEGVPIYDLNLSDPRDIMAHLKPTVSVQPVDTADVMDTALLKLVMENPISGDIPREDVFRVGLALLKGEGVPKNVQKGFSILTMYGADIGGNDSAIVAQGLQDLYPDIAYSFALRASADQANGATALLDDLEKEISFEQLIEFQVTAAGMPEQPENVSLATVRNLALMHFEGWGKTRSYGHALYWALIGAAAGDAVSQSITRKVEARVAGLSDPDEWLEFRNQVEDLVLEDWIKNDFAAQLSK